MLVGRSVIAWLRVDVVQAGILSQQWGKITIVTSESLSVLGRGLGVQH